MFGHQDNPDNEDQAADQPHLEEAKFNQTAVGGETDEPIVAAEPKHEKVVSPAGGFPRPTSEQLPVGQDNDKPAAPPADNDLVDIRKKALTELRPLLDQLDLPAEELFKTLMMMIQTSDDKSLIDRAYQAAHAIKDDKERGEALLDIVNEINYFSQPTSD